MHLSNPKLCEPSSQLENWKYSKVEKFLRLQHPQHQSDKVSALQDIPAEISELVGSTGKNIIFYNGQMVGSLSDKMSISKNNMSTDPRNYFDSLNCSQYLDGANIEIDSDESQHINLIYLYGNRIEGETKASQMSIRNSIQVSGRSSVKMFEIHMALNDLEFSLNQSTEIVVKDSANLERVKCFWLGDDSHTYDLENIEVKGSAHIRNLLVQMGGQWSRLEQSAKLLSEEAAYRSLGAFLVGGNGHCDMTTNIEHLVGHTTSEQLFKGVITENARSAFSGRIVIHQDAQKSSTEQLNQNVILGDRAEADSKPQLEVYADDVTASHGSTIGGLNNDEIFYLRSRGINKDQATEMVAKAYVDDLAERLDDSVLRQQVGRILDRGFARYVQNSLGDD